MAEFLYNGSAIGVEDRETVLDALLRHGHSIKHKCKSGVCQQCILKAVGSSERIGNGLDDDLTELGYFLSCQTQGNAVSEVAQPSPSDFPSFSAVVTEISYASSDVLLLTLDAPGFPGGPGRFIRLIHPCGTARQYSVATPAWEPSSVIRLHIRLLPDGEMSALLRESRIGDPFKIEGPKGKCRYRSSTGTEPMLLIGSGTGLAPLYAVVTDAMEQGHSGPIHLYHGAATSDRLYFQPELEQLGAQAKSFFYVACVEETEDESYRKGSPLAAALEDHPNTEGYKIYLCGHPDLVKHGQKKTFLAGASMKDIFADPFLAS